MLVMRASFRTLVNSEGHRIETDDRRSGESYAPQLWEPVR